MKYIAIFLLSFIAIPVSAQVSLPVEVEPETQVTDLIEIAENLLEQATTTQVLATSTASTTAIVPTTKITPTAPVVEAAPASNVVTEVIPIIPGGLSLTLSAKVPESIQTSETEGERDGLFGLVYQGFEEFVFKVFGW